MHSSDTYVAALGELTVGTVAIEWEDKKIWGEQPISAVYVHRLGTRLHGHRVGATLLEHADTVATENNLDRVRLDCNFANKKLCDHYEALGFKLVDTDWIIPTYEAARYERLVA
jgi:GNAT superfamily N-acetyltransferase